MRMKMLFAYGSARREERQKKEHPNRLVERPASFLLTSFRWSKSVTPLRYVSIENYELSRLYSEFR